MSSRFKRPIWAFAACLIALTAVAQEIAYSVRFEGVRDKTLLRLLHDASVAYQQRERRPTSMLQLRARVNDDVNKLRQALGAQGYFGADVTPNVGEGAKPVTVTFKVDPGPQYTLARADIELGDGAADVSDLMPPFEKMGLVPGEPVTVPAILNARSRILSTLRQKGRPFPNVPDPVVTVNHETRTVTAVYRVTPGPKARFATPTFTGNDNVETEFLQNRIPWRHGDPFNAQLLDKARDRLMETQLFNIVTLKAAPTLGPDDLLPVTVTVKERPFRTVKAGARYTTDEGPGVHAGWEHRNIGGAGERLELRGIASSLEQSVRALYAKPDWLRTDQTLRLNGRIANEDTDAYRSKRIQMEADVERKLGDRLTVGAGTEFRASDVRQKALRRDDQYYLFSLPGFLSYDTRNNVLDPTKGGLLELRLAPTVDVTSPELHYLRSVAAFSQHVQVVDKPRIVLAGRLRVGSILGIGDDEVPPDDKFYAGGGGSIRGYAYQLAGPVIDKKPVGGKTLLEMSAEFRFRVVERIGLVTFLDGGGVFSNANGSVKSNNEIFWGAGVGVRYFSPVGPFRFDLAFPLNRRAGVDDAFQIYLSMGQAF